MIELRLSHHCVSKQSPNSTKTMKQKSFPKKWFKMFFLGGGAGGRYKRHKNHHTKDSKKVNGNNEPGVGPDL